MKTITTSSGVVKKNVGGIGTEKMGLVKAPATCQDPLVVGVYGGPGAGKSRFCATAPGAIGWIATESKSRQTGIKEAARLGKELYLPSIDGKEMSLIRTANPMLLASLPDSCIVIGSERYKNWKPGEIQDEMQKVGAKITITSAPPDCCKRHYYRWHVNRVKHFAYQMLENEDVKTVVVDTFGTFVDDVSMANYGITGVIDPKEFGFAPREDMIKEIREFLNNMSQKNLILTHHQKQVWKDNAPTKKMTLDGKFSRLGHYISVMVHMERDDDRNVEKDEPLYKLTVQDCQANAELVGMQLLADEMISFANLATAVYPDTDEKDWE